MRTRTTIAGLDKLKAALNNVKKGIAGSEALEKVSAGIEERLVERTAQGRDAYGEAFAPYTPQYAKRLARLGKDGKTVTLRRSGAMLNSITAQAQTAQVALSFNSPQEALKARRIQVAGVGGRSTKRRFFALSEADRAWVVRAVSDGAKETVKEAVK